MKKTFKAFGNTEFIYKKTLIPWLADLLCLNLASTRFKSVLMSVVSDFVNWIFYPTSTFPLPEMHCSISFNINLCSDNSYDKILKFKTTANL